MKVYIAAPYTNGDPEQNTLSVLKVADKLLELGYSPIVPHLTHFWHKISPKPWETWIEIDKGLVECCDVLLRLPGESKGADIEVAYAKELYIPVFYGIDSLCDEPYKKGNKDSKGGE